VIETKIPGPPEQIITMGEGFPDGMVALAGWTSGEATRADELLDTTKSQAELGFLLIAGTVAIIAAFTSKFTLEQSIEITVTGIPIVVGSVLGALAVEKAIESYLEFQQVVANVVAMRQVLGRYLTEHVGAYENSLSPLSDL